MVISFGRPQFDDSAAAVIITRQEKVKKYEKMVSGEEILESCLHLNLIEHMNAEVCLGTVYDLQSAKRWLAGTFLAARLAKNPDHYKLEEEAPDHNLDDKMHQICQRELQLLDDYDLVRSSGEHAKTKCTEFGHAMARYYVRFETMKIILGLEPKSNMSDILSALSQAEEYREIRLKAAEKGLYKYLNKANGIKFPIKVDLALHAHKRSLLIQAELGGVEFPNDEQHAKHRRQYNQDKTLVFSHVHRLIRCITDCQIYRQDAVSVRSAMELARSFGARVWDNSPLQMKQLPNIGLVAIRKLAIGGINSIEALEAAEPHRIELLMSKNPPFGQKLLAGLKDFPKLRVSVKMMGKEVKPPHPLKLRIKAECGFINERPPAMFHRKPINICLIVERSDGLLVDFRRMSAKKLGQEQDVLLSADLTCRTQYITCYVMCDDIAGTVQYADLKPDLPASFFPAPSKNQAINNLLENGRLKALPSFKKFKQTPTADEIFDDNVDDQDLLEAVDAHGHTHIDTYNQEADPHSKHSEPATNQQILARVDRKESEWNPRRLDNGKWACNHKCRDKTACKHLCCREGVERPPKAPKISVASAETSNGNKPSKQQHASGKFDSAQTKRAPQSTSKGNHTQDVDIVDMTRVRDDTEYAKTGPRDYRNLHRLHEKINPMAPTRIRSPSKSTRSFGRGQQPGLSTAYDGTEDNEPTNQASSDYDDEWTDELPSTFDLMGKRPDFSVENNSYLPNLANEEHRTKDFGISGLEADETEKPFEDELSDIEAVMIGLEESRSMMDTRHTETEKVAQSERNDGNRALPIVEQDSIQGSEFIDDPSTTNSKRTFSAALPTDERLFFSTDSPERPLKIQKVLENTPPDPDFSDFADFQSGKKSEQQPLIPHSSPNGTDDNGLTYNTASSGANTVSARERFSNGGRPLPAWVDNFDPEWLEDFLREYGDLVILI